MKPVVVLLASAALVALAGCSMRQNIILHPDGSGSADVRVELGPLVVQYMSDLLGSFGDGGSNGTGGPTLFDLARIRSAFASRPGVKLTKLSNPERSTLNLGFSFEDIGSLFPAKGSSPAPLALTASGGTKTLRLMLSRATWPAVAAIAPIEDNPLAAALGPQADRPYTEAEYLDLLDYAFADYASKSRIDQAVSRADVEIDVAVGGTVLAEKGGIRTGNTVTYHIPLIRILTLEKPIDFSITFR